MNVAPCDWVPRELPPLRGDIYSYEHLGNHAVTLSTTLLVDRSNRGSPGFFQRFNDNAEYLQAAFQQICEGIRQGELLTADSEWLLDNFYVVEEQLREIRDDLPASYLRDLPKLSNGEPRLYRLAEEFVIHTDSVLDQEATAHFFDQFQLLQPLTIGEVWAVPIMLRIVLVENLRRVAAQLLSSRRMRSDVCLLLQNWKVGSPLPAELRNLAIDADVVAHCLTVAPNLFPEDATHSTALDQALTQCFPKAQEQIAEAHRRRAANQVTIGNIITSMRLISAVDWFDFFERTSLVERILLSDPARLYGSMEPATRDRYRHAVEDLAKYSGATDLHVAHRALARATEEPPETAAAYRRHVGYWLVDEGREELERELNFHTPLWYWPSRAMLTWPEAGYFGILSLIWLSAMVGIGLATADTTSSTGILVAMLILAALPVSELAVSLTNWLITHWLVPRTLPKLDFQTGIPHEHRTVVVVPSMLTGRREVDALLHRLEMHYVANVDPALRFALLTDFPDASAAHQPGDDDVIEFAVQGIRTLNERYREIGYQPFLLLHRLRQWNPSEGVWMGWERKRGKLVEFNRLLHGDQNTSYVVQEGDLSVLKGTETEPAFPFVITLDADTQLPLGTAQRLVGTLAHPLNRAEFSPDGERVVRGYGILQPRVTVRHVDGHRTRFTQLFANSRGFDPYATAASDVYQDAFGEGSFTGKGIYDVRVFERTMQGTFPDNQILSHDLIEGCHARVGLVSDIELVDGYPIRYDADARRTHRWVRGDWQISPWLGWRVPCENGARRNRLSWLSCWKIFDNLRRSLVPPAVLVLLIGGWMLVPSLTSLWGLIAAVCIGFPAVVTALSTLKDIHSVENWRTFARNTANDLGKAAGQLIVVLACLPYQAVLMTDAVLRTLVRMFVTHRKMLEWETAATTERRLARNRWSTWRQMGYVPVFALIAALVIPAEARLAALPWLVLWLLSPLIADFISRPIIKRKYQLSQDEHYWLRLQARNIWSFFEDWVNDRTNWLPPDNLQEYPQEKLAERVSPTNEGLFLVSSLLARDFGYVGLHDLCDVWERNLATLSRLPTLNGHFYNWYDTATLEPLKPRYVSTVDSGNLVASLLVVQQGTDEVCSLPILGPNVWDGLRDTVEMALQACRDLQPRGARIISPPLDNLTAALESLRARLTTVPSNHRQSVEIWRDVSVEQPRLNELLRVLIDSHRHPTENLVQRMQTLSRWFRGIERDVNSLLTWFVPSHDSATEAFLPVDTTARFLCLNDLAGLPERFSKGDSAIERLAGIDAAVDSARQLRSRFAAVGTRAGELIAETDFRFLYNPQRRLFSIGYNLESGQLDRSYYDMLCSEARLSSHITIAKGDVPQKHWFQLGRQLTVTAGKTGLLSWGGTMFEFLMPTLFQRTYDGSLLAQACDAAIARQQEYGVQLGLPWGVSESGFAALAVNSDYHYQSFGVPGLGLKRGLSKDSVIAPYAAMLALERAPNESIRNLQRLAKDGAIGRYGLYEAVDFTPERVPAGRMSLVVRSYMAHHLGMSLASLANVLLDGVVQRRFHAHPLIRATEGLLQESMSTATPLIQPHVDEIAEIAPPRRDEDLVSRSLVGYYTPTPRTHLLSNGAYSVMLTNTGGGFSRWGDIAVTRWRSDLVRDRGGQFLYLRDVKTQQVWSATYQPTGRNPDVYEVTYSIDKAEFHRRDGNWETLLEVTVSSEDPVEVRQLTVMNLSSEPRSVEVTSFAEISLTTPAADLAHPCFQKLFVETEFIEEESALLAHRRPREQHQQPLWAVHVLATPTTLSGDVEFETSRPAFLGRGRDVHDPHALQLRSRLTGTTGGVLDPVFSLRCVLMIPPHGSMTVAFSTGIADSRESALRLADQFHELRSAQRAFELAWAFSQVQLQHLHLTARRAQRFQQLGAYLLFPQTGARGSESAIRHNRQGQSGLWRFGISGDRPIVLVKIADAEQANFIRDVLKAREYWEMHGLNVDVVLLNTNPGSYLDALQELLQQIVQESARVRNELRSAVFLLRGAQIAQEDHWLLEAVAAMVLDARRGWSSIRTASTHVSNLTQSTNGKREGQRLLANVLKPRSTKVAPMNNHPAQTHQERLTDQRLQFWNGFGGFTDDGREYRLHFMPGMTTPAPWSNVIANPRFGCLVTESGGGYTWFENSRENKLTSWSNDPVTDPASERLWLRDDQTREVWNPLRESSSPAGRSVHHGQGYTRFLSQCDRLDVEVTISVAAEDTVKFVTVRLRNLADDERRISAVYFAELVLGVSREQSHMHIVTDVDHESGAILARNPYHPEFPEQVMFVQGIGPHRSVTADRCEFLGREFGPQRPAALSKPALSGRSGTGLDPCAAIQCTIVVLPGGTTEVAFLIGCGVNGLETQRLLQRYRDLGTVHSAVANMIAKWDRILTAIDVETPNPSFNLLVNRWLVYQTLSCRLWGRSAFYQSGGAYGFRDQLQDVLALVYCQPDLVRQHLLRAAARQYEEGDVQHWWHPPLGRGTRTRFSDDLLFLPFAVTQYIHVTGEVAVLDEVQPFLHSHPLSANEHERYELPQVSSQVGTLYEHCWRAIERSLRRGEHGLPLMGCGDWNDGMNLVGADGRGESVWVGWFLLVVIEKFVPLMKQRGDHERAERLLQHAAELRTSLEQNAWDGEWYLRAFFDDGTPLGSHENAECQLDSLSQSWAVLAKADEERTDQALNSVFEKLVFPADRFVALFQPPFDKSPLEPGYIKGYLPGVRENGGQYTHAVAWLIQALAVKQDGERAMQLFDLINPILLTQTTADVHRYGVEPYVMAADVYAARNHRGRGGWTWYTGSAAWMYRVAVESILGIDIQGNEFRCSPSVPADWNRFRVNLRHGTSTWRITIELTSDEHALTEQPLSLVDDGTEHEVTVHVLRRTLKRSPSHPLRPHLSRAEMAIPQ